MKDFNIIFSDTSAPQLPNGVCLGSVGEHNAVQLVITLPESMLTGITFYTITVGGIESAQIVSGSQNVDGAYLLDGVIYQPLTAAYTTQRITDMTVTAYARENGETVVVDKTQTVCGLMFIEGHPAPVPGGIVSEVAKLAEEVAAMEDDIPTAEEIAAWNEAAADKHTHSNKAVLDRLDEYDTQYITYRGIVQAVPVVDVLPDMQLGVPFPSLCVCDGNLYESDVSSGAWSQVTSGLTENEAAGLLADKHTHGNMDVLSSLSSSDVTNWNAAYADKHTHANKSTLDKFGESGGEPTFDGNPIGGGVNTYATPSALPNNAENGSVAVALADDPSNTIVYPTQTAGEAVSVDIASKNIMVGSPTFNSTAIDAAIAAQTVDLTGTVTVDDPDGGMSLSIIPVVSDPSTNEYTAAGITLDTYIEAATFTKKYAVAAILTAAGYLDYIKPDKIEPVDAEHEKIPFMAIYAFEALSNISYQGMPMDLVEGWNVALATVDKATHSDVTAIEVVSGAADLNDYLILSNSEYNTMSIEGVGASAIFTDTIVGEAGKQKGLYVRLSGDWMRCTLDGDA